MLIMTIDLLPDACQLPAGRNETGNPRRQNAMDPGFHGVSSGPRPPRCLASVWAESVFVRDFGCDSPRNRRQIADLSSAMI